MSTSSKYNSPDITCHLTPSAAGQPETTLPDSPTPVLPATRPTLCRRLSAALVVALLVVFSPVLPAKDRYLQIEILIPPGPTSQLQARDWAAVFQQIGQSPTFRQGRAGETTTLEDFELRGEMGVKVIGLLERDGTIAFRGRKFGQKDDAALVSWFEKLARHGAKGPPSEHPTWGLDEQQYEDVLRRLRKPVDAVADLSNPMKAIASLNVQSDFEIKFTVAAAERAYDAPQAIGGELPNVQQFSRGTALAIALSQYGLGFRPIVNPAGGYFLQVDVGTELDNLYPIGWKDKAPITTLVPGISKTITVELEDEPLDGLMKIIAQRLELPLVYAGHDLISAGRDVSRIKYSRRRDRISPFRLMSIMGSAQKLGMSVRTDESGRVFLWVTTKENAAAFEKRFARRPDRGTR